MSNDPDRDGRDAPADIDEALRKSGAKLAGRLPFLGHVTWLATRSAAHRLLFLQDREWRVVPPLMLEQFKLYFDRKASGLPVAYVSWAYLTQQDEKDFVAHQRIAPGAWNAGDRLWLVDFMTPFGGARSILNDMYGAVHKGRDVNLLYPFDGGKPRVTTLRQLVDGNQGRSRDSGPSTHH